jgi:hypothetical protein
VQQLHGIVYSRDARFTGRSGAYVVGKPARKRRRNRYENKKKMMLGVHMIAGGLFEAWLFLGQAFFTLRTKVFVVWFGATKSGLGWTTACAIKAKQCRMTGDQ